MPWPRRSRRRGSGRKRIGSSRCTAIFSRGFVRASTRASPPRIDRRPLPGLFVALAAALVAAAAASGQPQPAGGSASSPVRFVNAAGEAGLTLRNVNGELQKMTIDETIGDGICLYDVDDDGSIDVFIPNGSRARPFPPGQEPRSALYRNKGDGTFEDITDRAGVASTGYWAQGCVFGDYDDDGRVDLFLTGFGRYLLYRNLGGGRFQDATAAAGLAGGRGWSTGAAFADYDGDGWIDLYVSHYVDYDAGSPPLPLPGSAPDC